MRLDIADYVIGLMKQNGATASDVSVSEQRTVSVGTRLGKFEKFKKADCYSVTARAFCGQKMAVSSTEDISVSGLRALAERTVSMAKVMPENEFIRLANADEVYVEDSYFSEQSSAPDIDLMFDMAKQSEDEALAVPGICNSEGADVSYCYTSNYIKNSNGDHGYEENTQYSNSLSVVAKSDDGAMETDYDFSVVSDYDKLKSPAELGRTASKRAIEKLGSRKIKSCVADVIFDKRVAANILGYLTSAIDGNAVYKKSTFLWDKLGKRILKKNVNIIDDPRLPQGICKSKFDAELVRCKRYELVRDGVLNELMLNIETAAKLKMPTNGHSYGGSSIGGYNTYVENGEASVDSMIRSMKTGIIITDVMGMGIDLTSGNYSQGIRGFFVDHGEIAYPVKEVTVAGNMLDIFACGVFANDLEFLTSCNSPSMFVEGLTIAGE